MSDRLELAISAAREAGALARDRFNEPRVIETKSSPIDLVTDVDRACDKLLRERISAGFADDAIVTAEDDPLGGSTGYTWVVDPIDGTTNYAHAFPHFAISIGIETQDDHHAGVIYDPMKDELFSACRGAGAELNGRAISVSKTANLESALLGTGFAYDVHSSDVDNLELFARFMKRAQAIRRAGSAALDLAYVACGRFDGFWELSLHHWDVSAGILIVQEAGGVTSDLDGGPTPRKGERIAASNGVLHPALLEVLKGA